METDIEKRRRLNRDRQKKYRFIHSEKIKRRRKKYYHENKNGLRDKMRAYQQANKIHLAEKAEEYQKNHPEVRLRSRAKRRGYNRKRAKRDIERMADHYIVHLIARSAARRGKPISKKVIRKLYCDTDLLEAYKLNLEIKRRSSKKWQTRENI